MKILVIKLRGIGDCLLSIPAIRALREKYPDGHISVLTENKCFDVFNGNKEIDDIITIPSNANIFSMIETISRVRKQKFDMVVDLFGNPRSALITLLSGAKTRVGMDIRFRKHCYNVKFKGSPDGIVYAVESNLDMVRILGADTKNKNMYIPIFEKDELFTKNFIKEIKSPIIALNPVAGWETKSWGIEKFAKLADELIKKYNISILILHGPNEEHIAKRMENLMENKAFIVPDTTLKQMAAILSKCNLLITNDGALKHIAVSLDIPTITFFGATNPTAWHPKDKKKHIAIYKDINCRPCDKTECDDIKCLKDISVEECLEKLGQIHFLNL